jgi:two-component system NtrC family sensor kinase
MIFSFRRLSINGKLKLLVLCTAGVAVTLCCVAFVANDARTIRQSMVKQLSSLTEVLGDMSTAAIEFDDATAASQILESLKHHPPVELACLYTTDGRLFATYKRSDLTAAPPDRPVSPGHSVTWHRIEATQLITRDGRPLGTIFVRARLSELYEQIARQMGIATLVMLISLATAIGLSARLQRAISQPILDLARTAQLISYERDYSIRVRSTSTDELGILYSQFNDMLVQIQTSERALQEAHDQLEVNVVERTSQLSEAVASLHREVIERTRAESELKNLHQQLMNAARKAGMAEIATGVLHNIGNVLNSVNVSAALASERLRGARIEHVQLVAQMLEKSGADLGTFLTSDPKGKQIPAFLTMLGSSLVEDKTLITKELDNLTTKIDHIKTIVTAQQSFASVSGVIETFDVSVAIDDALKLNSAVFHRHQIEIVRDYEVMPEVSLDKQKLLQILVNLVKNGKDALVAIDAEHRRLTFRTRSVENDRLQIHICDNGIGIRPEHMPHIFTHGFTTKKDGHGFGLHSCANAARELGGSLTVESAGPGCGATFILELPQSTRTQ